MLLNRVEKLMMNNPLRAAVQRRFEARRLLEMGGPVAGGRCLWRRLVARRELLGQVAWFVADKPR
jgi:hypothetical protein